MNSLVNLDRETASKLTKSIWDFIQSSNLNPPDLFNFIYNEITKLLSDKKDVQFDQDQVKNITLALGKFILNNYESILKQKIGFNAAGIASGLGFGSHLIVGAAAIMLPRFFKEKSDQELKDEFFREFLIYLHNVSSELPAQLPEKATNKTLSGEQLYKQVKPAVVEISTPTATGSGVFFRESGLIVTNRHVVEGSQEVIIRLYNSEEYPGKILLSFRDVDLAFIQIVDLEDGINVPPLTESTAEGETVYAVGSPNFLTNTITRGTISSTGRIHKKVKYIQHDAAINGGSSGGPLFNSRGELIGLNTWGYINHEGLGFALPIRYVNKKYCENEGILKQAVDRKYCAVCGHSSEEPFKYCQMCGSNLKKPTEPTQSQVSSFEYKAECSCGEQRRDNEKYCVQCGQTLLVQRREN